MNKKELFNEEREIPGRRKVVRESNVPVLTSYAGLNPRSKSGYEREARVIKKIQKKYPKFFLFFKLFCILKISKTKSSDLVLSMPK